MCLIGAYWAALAPLALALIAYMMVGCVSCRASCLSFQGSCRALMGSALSALTLHEQDLVWSPSQALLRVGLVFGRCGITLRRIAVETLHPLMQHHPSMRFLGPRVAEPTCQSPCGHFHLALPRKEAMRRLRPSAHLYQFCQLCLGAQATLRVVTSIRSLYAYGINLLITYLLTSS